MPALPQAQRMLEDHRLVFGRMEKTSDGRVHHDELHKHMRDFLRVGYRQGRKKDPSDEL